MWQSFQLVEVGGNMHFHNTVGFTEINLLRLVFSHSCCSSMFCVGGSAVR